MTETQQDLMAFEKLTKMKESFFKEIGKVIIGQENILEHLLIALLSQGHTLLVGVPGLAKTLIIKTLSDILDLSFKRIQFTPDLMPSDITGTELIDIDNNTGQRSFRFFKGPVFANIVLADEINRTPPKTQSALLEAMQEHKVTAGGKSYDLDEPFFVLATQNPIEQEGTYPLPEAQVDRFMFKVIVDYPKEDEEVEIVKRYTSGVNPYDLLKTLDTVITQDEIIIIQQTVREKIRLSEELMQYIVKLTQTTRESEEVTMGASPRASLWLAIASKAHALLQGRDYVNPGDIQRVARDVLRHRVSVSPEWQFEGIDADAIITRVLQNIEVPSI
jgi:MoxR-like ATPase